MANILTEEYVPTQWVDGTAPAINALHLNHMEQGIMRVTDGLIIMESYDMQAILDRLTAVELRCTTLEGEVNTLQSQVATLQGEMTAVEARCTTLEGEVNSLQLAPPPHGHPVDQITNLQPQLDSKPTGIWSRSGTTLYIDIAGSIHVDNS